MKPSSGHFDSRSWTRCSARRYTTNPDLLHSIPSTTPSSSSASRKSHTGTIPPAGGVVAAVVFVLPAIILGWFLLRRRRSHRPDAPEQPGADAYTEADGTTSI